MKACILAGAGDAPARNPAQIRFRQRFAGNACRFVREGTHLEEILMNASILPRLRLWGIVGVLALAATAAMGQTQGGGQRAAKPQATKSGEKADAPAKKPAKPAGPAGYATEAEARAHCKGEVVWVDKDHFYHYAGSREYGKKPGAFTCEKG
jgi:hypothetical protein